jgi:hypothetical protein
MSQAAAEATKDYMKKHYDTLKGYTIEGAFKQEEEDDVFGDEDIYSLILRKGSEVRVAHILRDAEGNGPGHIEISEPQKFKSSASAKTAIHNTIREPA